jgi:hypothetical protein
MLEIHNIAAVSPVQSVRFLVEKKGYSAHFLGLLKGGVGGGPIGSRQIENYKE